MAKATHPPALVLGLGVHGLAIARSLGRHGIPVDALEADPAGPEGRSRYVRQVHPTPSLEDDRLIDALRAYARTLAGGRAVLFPTMDLTVPVVSAHRDALREHFAFTLAPAATIAELMDKTRLPGFLARSGVRHPATCAVRGPGDAEAVAATVGFPCVVKPALRSPRFKAAVVGNREALAGLLRRVGSGAGALVAQEWIPGEDSDVYFCFAYLGAEGTPRGVFVGRKLVQHPRGTGIAAMAEACDDDVVRQESLRLFGQAGYRGFGSTEFRRRPDTGEYVFIEFTVGRTDYNVACAVANGVDLPYIGYCDILGREIAAVPRQCGRRRWVDLGRAVRAILADGEPLRHPVATATRLLTALSPRNTFTLFDPADPLPFLLRQRHYAGAPVRALRRRLAAVRAGTGGEGLPWRN